MGDYRVSARQSDCRRKIKAYSYKPLFGPELKVVKVLKDSQENQTKLRLVMTWCRGFGMRHWRQLSQKMSDNKFEPSFKASIKLSWSKFKFASTVNPAYKQVYIWIFKTFLDLDGQKDFDEIKDLILDDHYDYARGYLISTHAPAHKLRLLDYFHREDVDMWLPLSIFPLIEVSKPRMDYAFLEYNVTQEQLAEVREKIFNYVMRLNIDEIFVPPPDTLHKVGNQKYNDGGYVRYDYERPLVTFDSMFKYQKFMTAPLTPREVWLPGKAIKNNNNFWMTICRQIISKDPVYPSSDVEETWERIRDQIDEILRFDISGFGFQYLREYLKLGISVIQELYPHSYLEEQGSIFNKICDLVNVQLEDGTFVYPPRGIGLGYYEDLKTMIMLALLADYDPISVYGDQGLIGLGGYAAIADLMEKQFSVKFEKVEFCASKPHNVVKWAGYKMSPKSLVKPKKYMEPLLGAFFSRFHWERKLALRGLAEDEPLWYKKHEFRLAFLYEQFYGWEFHKTETTNHFDNCGINSSVPIIDGYSKLYKVEKKVAPYSNNMFDITYQTPFRVSGRKAYPTKVSRQFQIARKKLYKETTPDYNFIPNYIDPRIEYNNKQRPFKKVLPVWADMLYLVSHGKSSGSITCGLSSDQILDAARHQIFAKDPFRALATGGYKILTTWRSSRPPDEEWLVVSNFLAEVSQRHFDYVRRCDLLQHPALLADPMYYDTNLIREVVSTSKKRKVDDLSTQSHMEDEVRDRVLQLLPSKIAKGAIDSYAQLHQFILEEAKGQEEDRLSLASSPLLEEDDDFYAAEVDLAEYMEEQL